MLTQQAAMIWVMVVVSGSDRVMSDAELSTIGEIVKHLPVFKGYDPDGLTADARACARKLREDDGLNKTLDEIRDSLSGRLRETAYALGCEVAIADGKVPETEARALDLIRQRLDISQLVAAAIQRGAKARHATI